MTMADIDLNFLARQNQQIISGVGILCDDNRVLTAMVTRLESAQPTILEQMRRLHSLIGHLDERVSKLETDGTLPWQVDAKIDAMWVGLLRALDERFTQIDERFISALNDERLGRG